MTSYYLSKQQPFISENNSSNRLQKFSLIMSNEETKQLAGLVAKTRALFENSNRNSDQSSKPTSYMTQKAGSNYNNNNRFQKLIPPLGSSSSENDSDKENSSSNRETIAPFLNQLKPTSKLATKFNHIFNNKKNSNIVSYSNYNNNNSNSNNNYVWNSIDSNNSDKISEQTKLILPNITSTTPTTTTNQLKNRWQMTDQYQPSSPPLYSSSSSSTASSSSSPPPSSLSCHSFDCNANELANSGHLSQSSSPSSNLWQASEETSKELNLPTSVRQAKLCFERGIQQQQQQSTLARTTPTHQLTKPVKSMHAEFSSSSTSTSSSVPSSPTSSMDNDFKSILNQKPKDEERILNPFLNSNRKQTLQPALNSTNLPHLQPSSSNKIKILKKNFSNKNSSTTKYEQQKPKDEQKYVQQSPRFLHLFQSADSELSGQSMAPVKVVTEEPVSIKEQTINLPKSMNATSTASIQIKTIKLKQQEPIVSIKSILRNKTPNMTDVKSPVSPKLNEKYVNAFLEKTNESAPANPIKVDQSSCVLPSKMKSKNSTALSDERQYPLQKSSQNNNNIHFKTWQNKVVQETSNGFAKNTNNSNNSNNCTNANNNLTKRVNKNAASAKENLLRWCRKHTQSYFNVSIENFSSSWSNGLAFCALIDHFIPGSFDYAELDPINARRNFELAFKTAEDRAGIVSLLDVDDMIEMGNQPDWKCVFTYVHSIYQKFRETP